MKRKHWAIILSVTLILCVAGTILWKSGVFKSESADRVALSNELRAEIEAFYGGASLSDDEDTVAGMQYYGTYNGYAILMGVGQAQAVCEKNIGGRIFSWATSFSIVAFCDGMEYDLNELYQSGEITEEALDEVLRQHNAFQVRFGCDPGTETG